MKSVRKENPLISILMPVYNAGDFLVGAIESMRNQTLKDWELIVVNDGSTDKSNEILKKYAEKDLRIKIYKFKKNKGLSYALNYGLNKAHGKYLARMDADDISYPKRLETQLRYLIRDPKVVAVGSQIKLINEKGNFIGYKKFPTDPKKIYQMMGTMMAIQHPTLLTYTKIIKNCSYANHTTAEDVSMFFKLLQYGNFLNTKEVLLKYRIRKNSNSLKNPKKTFYLTLKSRIKAVIDWSYKPTLLAVLINIAQFILITLLPDNLIISLYEKIRFNDFKKLKIIIPFYVKKYRLAFK